MRAWAALLVLAFALPAEAQVMARGRKNGSRAPLAALGAACTSGSGCSSGYCIGSVCVDYFTSLATANPAAECDCADRTLSGGESLVTTRSSVAYCTDSTGVLTSCAANKPRVSNAGVQQEGLATNMILQNDDVTSWTMNGVVTNTANSAAGPWGGTTMDTVSVAANTAGMYQCPTHTSSVGPFVFSAYVRASSGTKATGPVIQCLGSTVASCSCARADGTACTATIVNGNQDCRASSTHTTTVDRTWITATCNAALTQTCAAVPGGVYLSTTGNSIWGKMQYETGTVPTSPITTLGTAVARAVDSFAVTPSQNNSATGCVSAQVSGRSVSGTYIVGRLAVVLAHDSATRAFFYDTESVYSPASTSTVTGYGTYRAQWTGTAVRLDRDGVAGTAGAFSGTVGSGAYYFGTYNGSLGPIWGYLKNIKLGTSATGCQ